MTEAVARWQTTDAQFEALRPEWNELLARSRCQSVFLTWEWLNAWWRHIGSRTSQLGILTIRIPSGRLVGIGPFCITRSDVMGASVLRFLGTTRVSSEYLDVICESGLESQIAPAVAQALFDRSVSWDLLVLSDLLESATVLNELRPHVLARGVAWEETVSQHCPYLTLPETKEKFLSVLGASTRALLKRRTRKLMQLGAEIEEVDSADALLVSMRLDALFALHEKRWTMRGRKGNMGEDAIHLFHREVAQTFLERGWLRLYSLKVHDKVIASLYSFRYGGKLFYYQAGFDPSWSNYSPGLVLMGQGIERAISEGLEEFDYLRGLEPYKTRWTKIQRETRCLTLVPAGRLKGYAYFRGKQVLRSSKAIVKWSIAKILRRRVGQ